MSTPYLPDELIKIILTNFELAQTKSISRTCKRFHNIVDDVFWKPRTLNHFGNSTFPIMTILTWQQRYLIHLECEKHYCIKTKHQLTTAKTILAFDKGSMKNILSAAGLTVICNLIGTYLLQKLFYPRFESKLDGCLLALSVGLVNQYIIKKYEFQIFSTLYVSYYKISYYKTVLTHISRFAKKWNKVLPFKEVIVFGKYCLQN